MKTTFKIALLASATVLAGTMTATPASAADDIQGMFKEGKFHLDARYRLEFVDEEIFANNARASTLRTAFGFTTAELHGISGMIEGEDVTELGQDSYFNTRNAKNGATNHPLVADVEGTELNQAFVQYTGIPDTRIRAGRQAILLGSERFVGDVGFRQNKQTFDAYTVKNSTIPDTEVFYGYTYNVNRIFGSDAPNPANAAFVGDWQGEFQMLNVTNSSLPMIGVLTGYAYLFDNDTIATGAGDTETFGANLKGEHSLNDSVVLKYLLEYARQSDYRDNPASFSVDYHNVAPAVEWNGFTFTVGHESLGSDNAGAVAFQTPLATLHRFNGWSDRFLATPTVGGGETVGGLENWYAEVLYKVRGLDGDAAALNGLQLKFQYYDYESDFGSTDYGKEYGLEIVYPFLNNYLLEVQLMDYHADRAPVITRASTLDVQKASFAVSAKF